MMIKVEKYLSMKIDLGNIKVNLIKVLLSAFIVSYKLSILKCSTLLAFLI